MPMTDRHRRALEIHDAIHRALLHDGDPIGVSHIPAAQDEYDSCIGGVYRLLVSGATPHELAAHLATVQTQAMRINASPGQPMLVAKSSAV